MGELNGMCLLIFRARVSLYWEVYFLREARTRESDLDSKYLNYTIPAKLQTYFSFGKPIIASASGETKRIIKESNQFIKFY